jgi:hypothetical protein
MRILLGYIDTSSPQFRRLIISKYTLVNSKIISKTNFCESGDHSTLHFAVDSTFQTRIRRTLAERRIKVHFD